MINKNRIRSDLGLLAVRYDGEPAIRVGMDSISRLSDQQYFRGVCSTSSPAMLQDRYRSCN
ncbi:MAG TPA: hypothetical protein VFE88_01715 [Candidatus Nanoarchaeia archaeon]|nr:hypothetical protein [Candidatus Nanoarchaeia archaeon]